MIIQMNQLLFWFSLCLLFDMWSTILYQLDLAEQDFYKLWLILVIWEKILLWTRGKQAALIISSTEELYVKKIQPLKYIFLSKPGL